MRGVLCGEICWTAVQHLLTFLNSPLLDPVPIQMNLLHWDPVS